MTYSNDEHDDASNHRRLDCYRFFRLRSKKISKLRVTGLCEWNSPVTGEFPAQRAVRRKKFPFDDVLMLTSKFCYYVSKATSYLWIFPKHFGEVICLSTMLGTWFGVIILTAIWVRNIKRDAFQIWWITIIFNLLLDQWCHILNCVHIKILDGNKYIYTPIIDLTVTYGAPAFLVVASLNKLLNSTVWGFNLPDSRLYVQRLVHQSPTAVTSSEYDFGWRHKYTHYRIYLLYMLTLPADEAKLKWCVCIIYSPYHNLKKYIFDYLIVICIYLYIPTYI